MNNEIDTAKSKEYIIEFIFRKYLYHQYPTSESSEIMKNFIFNQLLLNHFEKEYYQSLLQML